MTASTPNAAPAGCGRPRRFWLTVAAFALANAAVWVGYHRFQQSHKPGLLRVERFSQPAGATVDARPRLAWAFNLDVAPPPRGEPAGTITPAVPGTWSWTNPRSLSFTPADPLPKATRFTLTLPASRFRTPEGFALREPFVTAFQTAALTLRDVRQRGLDGDRPILELQFDDVVLPADLMRHLTLTAPDGKPLACEPHGAAEGTVVRVRTAPVPLPPTTGGESGAERHLRVAIKPGLAGRAGPLGTANAIEKLVAVDAGLVATDARAYAAGEGKSAVRVEFNRDDVDVARVKQVLMVEPPVEFTAASSSYGGGVELSGDFAPGTRYAIKLTAPPAGSDRAKFPRPAALNVFVPDHAPAVWFEHDAGYLGSRGNRTLLAHAVNVFDLRIRVTRLYDSNLVAWRNAAAGRGRWRGASEDAYAAPVAQRTIRLTGRKNEKQEVRLALDELLPAGTARDGAYRVELSTASGPSTANGGDDDADFGGYGSGDASGAAVVTLSDLGLSAKLGRDSATAWVTSLSTAAPAAGVRVRVFSSKNQPLGEAVSDADGVARVALAAPAVGETPTVVVADRSSGSGSAGDGGQTDLTWLDLRDAAVTYREADTGGRPYLRSGYEAFVYADRGVYRPGETVRLRALVRGPDDATPVSFPVSFQIVRPDLRNWRSQTATLDRDGAAGFELALPTDLPTGRWTAKVCLPGDGGAAAAAAPLGAVTFQVEEFMPDRMKVELALGDGDGTRAAPPSAAPPANAPALRVALISPNASPLRAAVQADYLFGRPVAGRPATLTARVDPAVFRPAGWSGWTFGDAADTAKPLGTAAPLGRRGEMPATELDDAGHAAWKLDVRALIANGEAIDANSAARRGARSGASAPDGNASFAGPWTLTATASVTEEGGRAVSATRRVEVDLAPHYVGLRRAAPIVRPGVPATFDVAIVSPAGTLAGEAPAELHATLYRESWNNSLVHDGGHYRYESTRLLEPVDGEQAAVITRASGGRGTCTVTAPVGGSYVLRVRDAATGCVASASFYAGHDAWDDEISREHPERLEVVLLPPGGPGAFADALRRRDLGRLVALARGAFAPAPAAGTSDEPTVAYATGDRPRVLVRSPFKGRLLLTVETDTVVWSRVLDMAASQVTVPIEVTPACRPNAYVTATVVRAIDPEAVWRPHRATGVTRLRVDSADRRLNVAIDSPQEVRPSTTLSAAVLVTDSAGHPVPDAAVTMAAVDEGICRLTNFATPDPFAFFSGVRALAVHTADLYGRLLPEVPRPAATSTPGGDAGDGADRRHRSPVAAKRVKPVALFSGVVRTDAHGVARVDFPVPQFAGSLQLMAVAYRRGGGAREGADSTVAAVYAPAGFGSGEAAVTVRSPLLVQSSWPRFAAPGDRFLVPLVVFNNTAGAGVASVTLELLDGAAADGAGAPGPLKFAVGDGRRVTRPVRIEAGGQASEAIEIVATDQAGVAHVRLVARLGDEQFEEMLEFPVRPASPALTRGGYASASPKTPATITIPTDLLARTGNVRVSVTPWPALALPEGLEYLDRYPYGCAEQTLSGLMPLVSLGDVGTRVAPHLFDRERIAAKVQAGIVRLLAMRTADGGLGTWPGDRAAWPWAGVYAAHFAVEARAAGHEVPDDFHDGLLAYARTMLAKPGDNADTLETQAYACYVLALAGKPERAAMSRLGELLRQPAASGSPKAGGVESDRSHPVPAHSRAQLAAAWMAAGRRDLAEGLIPQSLPAPRAARQQGGNVGSPVRDRAVLLTALLAVQPDRPDLPALAQALADDGRNGGWRSTQDTAFALMALGRYLRQAAGATPYAAVELWDAGKKVGSAGPGASIAWSDDSLPPSGEFEVRVTGDDGAKAHVSWLSTGVPARPPADADRGITVRRQYLDDRGAPLAPEAALRSGDLIRVELSIEAATPLRNVVIEDLLPAGLEIENPRLVTQAPEPAAAAADGPDADGTPRFADRRLDIRDDRLILVGDLPAAGRATYVYTARAVAPGTFVVPPVRAECMYDIGTSGLSGGAGATLRVGPASAVNVAHAP